jgi:tRNA (guanine-N7-)-methyltransferase
MSNQDAPHEELGAIVKNHVEKAHRREIAPHTLRAFAAVETRITALQKTSLILDSGCGAGDSTLFLAKKYPDYLVLGIDKSSVRLHKVQTKQRPDNVLFAQADQFDFWRLLAQSDWNVVRHFIFYPNPWPKKAHIKRRIHGHPAFIELPNITKNLELRSNWLIYLEEFSFAWSLLTGERVAVQKMAPGRPISLFEKKFADSGHQLFQLKYGAE